jgi:hypothetical protein
MYEPELRYCEIYFTRIKTRIFGRRRAGEQMALMELSLSGEIRKLI